MRINPQPDRQSRTGDRRALWKKTTWLCEAKIKTWSRQGSLPPKRTKIITALANDPEAGSLIEQLRPPGSAADWPTEKGLKYIVHNFDKHCPGIWEIKNETWKPTGSMI
jgi:hypothetical protein